MKRITILQTDIYCKSRQIMCWVSQVLVWKMAVRPLPLQACIGFGGTVGTGLILHPDHKTLIYPLGTTIVLRDRVWTQTLLLLTTSIYKYQGNRSPLRLKVHGHLANGWGLHDVFCCPWISTFLQHGSLGQSIIPNGGRDSKLLRQRLPCSVMECGHVCEEELREKISCN